MLVLLYPALAVLLLLSILLLLPWSGPVRSSLVPLLSQLAVPSWVLLAVGGVLLSSSYLDWQRHRRLLSSSSAGRGDAEFLSHSLRQAEAELQLVLSAAFLLVLAAVARITGLLREQMRLSASLLAMQRQATGASNAYLTSLAAAPTAAAAAAHTATAAPTLSSSTSASASASSAASEQVKAENVRLQSRLQAMERQARSASEAFLASDAVKGGDAVQQLQVMKVKVDALQRELDRGREEQKRLQLQLEDYQLLLGDTRKKQL